MNDFCRVAQLTFVLSLVVACAGPVQARAEIGPLNHYQLPLRPSAQSVGAQVATSSALAAVLAIDPHEPEAVLRARQKRAQRILAAGAGLALSAAITPIYVLAERNRDRCFGSDPDKGRVPLISAAVVGTLGVAITVGGASWLGLERRRHGSYASRRERLIDLAIGALAFALGQTLQGSLFFADRICHS